jgi:hypothetical protein
MPNRSEDIKDYKQGITDEWRELIFWRCKAPWKNRPVITNWDALYNDWLGNEKF